MDFIFLNEEDLSAADRKKIPSEDYGIPDKRKYPLNDAQHTILAIKFFKFCDSKSKKQLATNIVAAIKKYKLESKVKEMDNTFTKYLSDNNITI